MRHLPTRTSHFSPQGAASSDLSEPRKVVIRFAQSEAENVDRRRFDDFLIAKRSSGVPDDRPFDNLFIAIL
jgi:hypothetical protein